ncbi:O-antigen transporter, partial [Escherichia coli]|nr:O-antigen transporter [Escherichia coli]
VTKYGAIGISLLWAIVNFIYFVLWNLHLLKKITKTLYPQWVLIETLLPLIMLFLIMTFVRYFFVLDGQYSRFILFLLLCLLTCVAFVINLLNMKLLKYRN